MALTTFTRYNDGSGWARRHELTWNASHDAATATPDGTTPSIEGSKWGSYYDITRGWAAFDTSALGAAATIHYAYIRWKIGLINGAGFWVDVVEGVQNMPLVATDYGDQRDYTALGAAAQTIGWAAGEWHDIPLNAVGLAWISKTGYSKFCFRNRRDTDDDPPPSTSLQNMTCGDIELVVSHDSIELELRTLTDTEARLAFLSLSPRQYVAVQDKITLEMIRNIEMAAKGRFWIDEEGNAVWKSRLGRMG